MHFGPDPDQTITLHRGQGCYRCFHKGCRCRTGLFELLTMTDEIADLIVKGASQAEITAARAVGMYSLWHNSLLKVLDGATTPHEVLRVSTAT